MLKRQANNSGTVTKLSGNRSKPFLARLPYTQYWDGQKMVTRQKSIGCYKTESDARKALRLYLLEHPEEFDSKQKNKPKRALDVTVNDMWEVFQGTKLFAGLSNARQVHLRCIFNHLSAIHNTPMSELNTTTLTQTVNGIDSGITVKNGAIELLSRLFELAIADDIVLKNYAKYIEKEKYTTEIERICFSPAEIEEMKKHEGWIFDLLLIEMYSGARLTEIYSLKKEDVFLNAEIPYFHISKGKNKFAVRDVPIHSSILGIFKRLVANCTTEYLIRNSKGKEPNSTSISCATDNIVGPYLEIRHHPYDAKHTFITRCAECGVDQLAKVFLIGHTPKITSERVYTHLSLEFLKIELEKVKY